MFTFVMLHIEEQRRRIEIKLDDKILKIMKRTERGEGRRKVNRE